ncbi:hypothetical protein H0H92_002290, partial [Tricholoma furcatifolium]
MDKLGGGFWEGGLKGLEQDGGGELGMGMGMGNVHEEEERSWVEHVAETLEALKDIAVAEG